MDILLRSQNSPNFLNSFVGSAMGEWAIWAKTPPMGGRSDFFGCFWGVHRITKEVQEDSEPARSNQDAASGQRTEEFMRLFVESQRRIYGLITAMVTNAADADDLFQEVSAGLWRKFDQFEPGTNFAAWALQFARYIVLQHFERAKRARLRFDAELLNQIADEATVASNEADLRFDALRSCLSQLDARARRLIDLRYEPGATIERVSQEIGKSPNATYKALSVIHSFLLNCVRGKVVRGGSA
jgi:RNA polymerase sigma-70 factor, ECF subfamily